MLIPLEKLINKHRLNITGVLHCGASTGQEAADYYRLGAKNMLFIEAIPDVYEKLERHIAKYPGARAINACLSDVDEKEVLFNIASNEGQSSSFLEFGTHKQAHPDVSFVDQIQLKTKRLDTLIEEINLNIHEFNFLNMDLQGAELLALRGLGEYLKYFKYAYMEVNKDELYKGCPMVEDLDMYLIGFGFRRAETSWAGNFGWGDAFYVKK